MNKEILESIQSVIDNPVLILAPDDILSTSAHPVEYHLILKNLYKTMVDVMRYKGGIGLAANQVGLPIRFIVIKNGNSTIGLLNPEVSVPTFSKYELNTESCLSFPGISFPIKRSKYVKVKAVNQDGQIVNMSFKDKVAICIQHEMDHLNGITIFDHMKKFIPEHNMIEIENVLKDKKFNHIRSE